MNFYEIIHNFHDTLRDKRHDAILILSMVKDTRFAHVNTSFWYWTFLRVVFTSIDGIIDHRLMQSKITSDEKWSN